HLSRLLRAGLVECLLQQFALLRQSLQFGGDLSLFAFNLLDQWLDRGIEQGVLGGHLRGLLGQLFLAVGQRLQLGLVEPFLRQLVVGFFQLIQPLDGGSQLLVGLVELARAFSRRGLARRLIECLLARVHLFIGHFAGQIGDGIQDRRDLGGLGHIAQSLLTAAIVLLELLDLLSLFRRQRRLIARLLLHLVNAALLLKQRFLDGV